MSTPSTTRHRIVYGLLVSIAAPIFGAISKAGVPVGRPLAKRLLENSVSILERQSRSVLHWGQAFVNGLVLCAFLANSGHSKIAKQLFDGFLMPSARLPFLLAFLSVSWAYQLYDVGARISVLGVRGFPYSGEIRGWNEAFSGAKEPGANGSFTRNIFGVVDGGRGLRVVDPASGADIVPPSGASEPSQVDPDALFILLNNKSAVPSALMAKIVADFTRDPLIGGGFTDGHLVVQGYVWRAYLETTDTPQSSGLESFVRSRKFVRGNELRPGPVHIYAKRPYGARFGGLERFHEWLAVELGSLGLEVTSFHPRKSHDIRSSSAVLDRFSVWVRDLQKSSEQSPELVFALTGVVYGVLATHQGQDVRIIYGAHFWRDFLGDANGSPPYFNERGEPITRPEFAAILKAVALLYANSEFTRSVIEQQFGVRPAVLHSTPNFRPRPLASGSDERLVISVGTSAEKGFNFVIDLALASPSFQFLVFTNPEEQQNVDTKKLPENLMVLPYSLDFQSQLDSALVVLVPSFGVAETFSRVTLEALQTGVPVIAASKGNLPFLLETAGVCLPADIDAWSAELRLLASDSAYRRKRSEAALVASNNFSQKSSSRQLSRLVAAARNRVLVCVGSGLGNLVHATPAITAISRHFGHPVDVLVAEDHPGSLFIFGNIESVATVFSFQPAIFQRRYDLVITFQSFSPGAPEFNTARQWNSRDWGKFSPGGALHEAEFNFEAAKAYLGMNASFDPHDYFVGDLRWTGTQPQAIGLHAGSKSGIWASKRWPRFEALAGHYLAEGRPVRSFGLSEEAVPATEDLTGLSLEDTAKKIAEVGMFVGNDSGLTQLAAAIGVPTVIIFGPTNPATRKPLNKLSRVIAPYSIDPCELDRSSHFYQGVCDCVQRVSLERVVSGIDELAMDRPTLES